MKYCPDCCTMVDEDEQTLHEYDNGICPVCGGGNVREISEDPPDHITQASIIDFRKLLSRLAYLRVLYKSTTH